MNRLLLLVAVLALAACNNNGTVETELDSAKTKLDTLVNRVERSEVVDSIKSKGGKILDSVKSKGGRLVDKAEEKFERAKAKDSTR